MARAEEFWSTDSIKRCEIWLRSPIRASLSGILLALAFFGRTEAQTVDFPQPGRNYRIGFSQIVDHPALNGERQGFIDGLREAGLIEGKNLVFEYQNAQGEVANARNIAEKFLADRVDLLAVCSTPSAQAAIKVARGNKTPVVFGCVTDPVATGILVSLSTPTGTNVTGLYDSLPVAALMGLMTDILPQARKIGTVYNSGDANSGDANAIAKAEAQKRGLTWVEAHITSSAEVKTAIESLIGRVDALYMLEDNTTASAFDAVAKMARDNRLPLLSLDTVSAKRGALVAYGVDNYKMGFAWAQQVAVPVLRGRDPATLVPVSYNTYDLYLNTASAARDGITLPAELLRQAREVYDK